MTSEEWVREVCMILNEAGLTSLASQGMRMIDAGEFGHAEIPEDEVDRLAKRIAMLRVEVRGGGGPDPALIVIAEGILAVARRLDAIAGTQVAMRSSMYHLVRGFGEDDHTQEEEGDDARE